MNKKTFRTKDKLKTNTVEKGFVPFPQTRLGHIRNKVKLFFRALHANEYGKLRGFFVVSSNEFA